MAVRAHSTTEPTEVVEVAGGFLRSHPVAHNIALTILGDRIARPSPGRYWWVTEAGEVRGYAFQSPPTFSAAVVPMADHLVDALVDRMAEEVQEIPGVIGEAATAAAFAGRWSERQGIGAHAHEGQRIYVLRERPDLTEVGVADGGHDLAGPGDVDQIVAWMEAFDEETGMRGGTPDLPATIRARVDEGHLHVWRADGGPVAFAGTNTPVEGVVRVGPVYTPPDRRGRGYATALVATASASALDRGAQAAMLYTQLSNARSNGIYRRIGYRAAAEVLSYRF